MINFEENANFEAMQNFWLYMQIGFLYLLKLKSEQV